MQRSYIKVLFLSGLLVLMLSAALNYVVDPYGLYRWVELEGFNKLKPKSGPNGRLVKPYRVVEVHPKTLILGNSRAEVGFDPESPQWPAAFRPVFNMALPASGIETSLRSLQHSIAAGKPALAVIDVDFFDFLSNDEPNNRRPGQPSEPSDFEKRLLINADGSRNRSRTIQRIKDHATMLFSLNALIDSLQTIAMQHLPDQANLTALGFNPMHEYRRFVRVDGHHLMFRQVETTYLTNYFRTMPTIYIEGSASSPAFDQLRMLIALCRASDIRLVLYIHPYHAHMLESYRIAGLWPLFEEWKRALVRIVDENPPGAAPVELWDFSGYNEITVEPVPAASDKGRSMHWYWEAGHYKREVGELALARMLGSSGDDGSAPAMFGVKLNGQNIEGHLTAIRDGQQKYADARREEIAELEKLSQTIRARTRGK